MNEKTACSSFARFAIGLAVFAIFALIWTVCGLITQDISMKYPFWGFIHIFIQLVLLGALPIAAAFLHSKTWLLRVIWFIPYATGMVATQALVRFGVETLSGYHDDKTIVGLLLGIPILALAILLAALAALVSARLDAFRSKYAKHILSIAKKKGHG
jgi:hypothetical protein